MKFLTFFLVGVRHTIGSGIAYLEYNVSIDNIMFLTLFLSVPLSTTNSLFLLLLDADVDGVLPPDAEEE